MYLLDFWEQNFEEEVMGIFNGIKTFIMDIGMQIYGTLVDLMGEMPAKMTLMTAGIALVIFILLKIINR